MNEHSAMATHAARERGTATVLRHGAVLHAQAPLTPAGVLRRHRLAVPMLAAAFVALAAAARVDGGRLLLAFDEPVSRLAVDARTGWADQVVKAVTGLGGLTVVTAMVALLVLLVWHQCRALALTLMAAAIARPALEWAIKELVSRERPEIDRLVAGNGPSFPSGHVIAAIAVWGLLPPVVALVSGHRTAWRWSVAISAVVIALVAFSRVYLGVHWLTDVVGSLVLGALYLVAAEWFLSRCHRRRPCAALLDGHEAQAG